MVGRRAKCGAPSSSSTRKAGGGSTPFATCCPPHQPHPSKEKKRHMSASKTEPACCSAQPLPEALPKDPVCGMSVKNPAGTFEYQGTEYVFCGRGCLEKFRANPSQYLAPQKAAVKQAPAGVQYTCPMHPEIVRDGPGACPICGMALEPKDVIEEETNPELLDMHRRFWICAALTVPLLVFMIWQMVAGMHALPPFLGWIQLALATPVVLWGGLPFFERGWASIRSGNLNMFTLIALGTGV